ncbi:MAG TPA: ABC transporter ATP-binding protein [Polyangiaceae bacterium]|nr:ABC transporter ATP-binding protein [Polyangiaceae bacterium]
MQPPVLECRDVTAGYPGDGGSRSIVFSGVSFRVGRGERLVVLGRSGAGKSTLLRLLNRLDDPVSGTVSFDGRPLADYPTPELRREVALVLQTPIVFEGTVRRNLLVRPHGIPAADDSALGAALEEVGLTADFLGRPAEELSVGERQRLCLARALLANPRALLLDEPTSALDPRSLAIVAELLLALGERHRLALVVATHQAELAKRLGGPFLVLERGAARAAAAPADVASFFEGAD